MVGERQGFSLLGHDDTRWLPGSDNLTDVLVFVQRILRVERGEAPKTKVYSMLVISLVVTEAIKIFYPTVVGEGQSIFFVGDEQKVDWRIAGLVRKVERMERLVFIAEDVDGQIVQFFDPLDVLERCGPFDVYQQQTEKEWESSRETRLML